MNTSRCFIELDPHAFAHNLQRVKELAPKAKVMAVIKADGYGHGMELAAKQLHQADEFAVTSLEDVRRLHSMGINKPLTLLSAQFTQEDLSVFSSARIRPVIYDYEQLDVLDSSSEQEQIALWLKVDTGMGRLGFHPDELPSVYQRLRRNQRVTSISLMTHFANADHPQRVENEQQLRRFQDVLATADAAGHHYAEVSLLNSAGVVAFAEQAYDMVRPGLMLYGISPQANLSAHKLGLKPVMSLRSSVISVRRMPAGSAIGYGGTYTLDADSRVAYIACGYGDGYPRHARNGTPVLVNDFLVPLIGRVSMDMIAVDVGELPVRVGDAVVLWGEQNPIETVAEHAGTIAYELTCGITARVERIQLD